MIRLGKDCVQDWLGNDGKRACSGGELPSQTRTRSGTDRGELARRGGGAENLECLSGNQGSRVREIFHAQRATVSDLDKTFDSACQISRSIHLNRGGASCGKHDRVADSQANQLRIKWL